jgi:hypothetical protein
MKPKPTTRCCLIGAVLFATLTFADTPDVERLLTVILRVGPEGRGNAEATRAWRELARSDVSLLPKLLAALDRANPLAANWIRAAVETIAERAISQGKTLPTDAIEAFVIEQRHDPRTRRLGFELLRRVDPSVCERLIATMSNDPSVELRREAVQRVIDRANQLYDFGSRDDAKRAYLLALASVRDRDQTADVVKRLRELGVEVDLPRHFGFVTRWKLIGPFDNTATSGFDVTYPPEREIDFAASYAGKTGPVTWIEFATTDDYGLVDLNKAFPARYKGAIAYAAADVTAGQERDVELRLGCVTAWKCWLNGRLVFERDEYHRGMEMDQYRIKAKLRPGPNRILLKICQNEQTEDWAQRWLFQFRICDSTGSAVVSNQ